MNEQFFEDEKKLSASETIVMKAIWSVGEDISVPDLIQLLKKEWEKDYARTTVTTFLLKLTAKGFVTTYHKGKLSFVHAEKSEEDYRTKLLEDETKFWFQGKFSKLLSALCGTQKLTQEDVEEIRKVLDDNMSD